MMPDGSALCKLRLRIDGEWIQKMDVGGESEQKDEGDRHKAAISDALKRAAVKFGIGRYLYRIPSAWFDYDPAKKKFATTPTLPANCYPKKKPQTAVKQEQPAPAPTPAKPANGNGSHKDQPQKHDKAAPRTWDDLKQRIAQADAAGAKKGYFSPGQLRRSADADGERAPGGMERVADRVRVLGRRSVSRGHAGCVRREESRRGEASSRGAG